MTDVDAADGVPGVVAAAVELPVAVARIVPAPANCEATCNMSLFASRHPSELIGVGRLSVPLAPGDVEQEAFLQALINAGPVHIPCNAYRTS